ncbi:MAG: RNA polymerase sigma factor RpoD/SigA [Cyclobacteriaceae bacterium]|jgi:RNA polymerase primary sigma factor|nr:RNA polymerase sigma factor RpoD/SigA [Cyclobacteriaceae bacterium]
MRQLKITSRITNRETQSLDKYLTEIAKISLISAEEEVNLAQRIRQGDSMALEKLVNANLRFVVSVAKQYHQVGMTLSDLINEGNLGLIKAASRFDETRGFKFISYAVWWIRQCILQALAEQSRIVRLPMNRIGSLNKINQSFSELEQKHQREPTNEELGDVLEITPDNIGNILTHRGRNLSMDAPMGNDGDAGNLMDVMPDGDAVAPDASLIQASLVDEIKLALSTLSERESQVLSMYYGLSGGHALSLHDISNQFDLTPERVRQIKEKATRKLRRTSRLDILRSYLG